MLTRYVALRKESVDRNLTWHFISELESVALRKESVDRNIHHNLNLPSKPVALRKESVDRNSENPMISVNEIPSLSARRAWIEIRIYDMSAAWNRSLSARRAWIEISG